MEWKLNQRGRKIEQGKGQRKEYMDELKMEKRGKEEGGDSSA